MAATATQPSRLAGNSAKKMSLADLRTSGRKLPTRVVMHGVDGVGKTSFAANAPKPVFLMTRGETGLETLIDSGQLADTPHFPEAQTWEELMSACDVLLNEPHDFKTLVLDTGNGAERLCHEEVCRREYSNEWGSKGFTSYQQGFEVSLADWRLFLSKLDAIREQKLMAIIILCHTKVATFKNPGAADYDRYEAKMHAKSWGLLKEWADIVLFADYEVEVVTDKAAGPNRKGKGVGGQYRIMHTTRTATYDAKNRHGLPDEIEMGETGIEAWKNFVSAMKGSK